MIANLEEYLKSLEDSDNLNKQFIAEVFKGECDEVVKVTKYQLRQVMVKMFFDGVKKKDE